MTNKDVDKSKMIKEKRYILEERKLFIFQKFHEGFTKSDIARMVGVDKSVITNIFKENENEYKKWILLNCK